MKILNAKMISASCNLKTSKMEGPTEKDSSCQTLTSSNPPLSNPNDNIVDNSNDSGHLKQLNYSFIPQISNNLETPIIIKNSKKQSINSKTLDLFNKTSIKDISINEIINELENDDTVNNNQRSISCENIEKIDQCINFYQKIKSLEETIAKQNQKLDDLFSKLSYNKINITKPNTPTKNIYEEKAVSEDLTKESKLKKEKNAKKLDAQLIVARKKHKEHYYKNNFSKIQTLKTKSNNYYFTNKNVETINNELDDINLSVTKKKKVENYRKIKKKTVLIVGDSMLNGIEESKLSKTRHIRLHPIPGGKTDDIKENSNDLLHEELQKVIIHAGTNNAMTDTPKEIIEKLISLKHQIESILPKCEVPISNLIMRMDEPKAAKINEEVNRIIKSASINFVENSNMKGKQLGKCDLHLNIQGNKIFARILLNAIRN